MKAKFAGIQYLGDSGVTQICKEAVIKLIHAGEDIKDVKILTFEEAYSNAHALLLTPDTPLAEINKMVILQELYNLSY